MTVSLAAVEERDHPAFFAMLREYMAEMDRYDPTTTHTAFDVDLYITAMLEDMEGREFLWILQDGQRAGFAIVRYLPDFPDDRRMVATIGEFYVQPAFRRQGVGAAAVQAILDDHRARGTYEVEAGILRDNFLARAFWARMGFELRFYQTARRLARRPPQVHREVLRYDGARDPPLDALARRPRWFRSVR